MFVPCKAFKPILIFMGKTRGLTKGEHLKGGPHSQALIQLTNIRLDWKGFSATNALAYFCLFVSDGGEKSSNIDPRRPELDFAEEKHFVMFTGYNYEVTEQGPTL